MSSHTLLVVANPAAHYLKWLAELPQGTEYAVGNKPEEFGHLAERADVLLYCMNPGMSLKEAWKLAPRLQWIHSMSAGLESSLFPELAASTVPMTNARGVFKESLGEFAMGSIFYFAKDVRRLVRNQMAAKWEQFDVEMVSGKTLGILGYGEIGRAAALRAHAMGMKIHAIRRRPHLSEEDPIVEKSFTVQQRVEMLAGVDYFLVAAPLTAESRGLIGEPELRAMKPSAVVMNVGRGPVIVESALVRALSEGWIRGAALDVFDQEPLPADHPFWKMENVLLSPHSADHTDTWQDDALKFFIQNFHRFENGEPLLNIVDKKSGY